MDSTKKLYIALALLVALGGVLYLQTKDAKEEAKSYSYEAKVADLPKVEISDETKKSIDRIELSVPAEDKKDKDKDKADSEEPAASEKPSKFVLVKKGEEEWTIESPGPYKANASNVQSLLDNIVKLKVVEAIATGTDSYDRWDVTDDKAIHVVLKKGDESVLDAYFGQDGSRGQMVRIAGKDGVFAAKGYSKFMYNRDLKGWREKTIFKFDDAQAESVVVKNENGEFRFDKVDDKWTSAFTPADAKAAKPIERFKDSKVGDLLRAYKNLNAADFGDGKSPADVHLDQPLATVTIKLKGDGGTFETLVGDSGEGKSRWIKTPNDAQIYSISSWAADWATANVDKFQEPEPKADEAKETEAKADSEKADTKKADTKKAEPKKTVKASASKPAAPKPAPVPN